MSRVKTRRQEPEVRRRQSEVKARRSCGLDRPAIRSGDSLASSELSLVKRYRMPEAGTPKEARGPKSISRAGHLASKRRVAPCLERMSLLRQCLPPKNVYGCLERMSKRCLQERRRTPKIARGSPKQEARDKTRAKISDADLQSEENRGEELRGEDSMVPRRRKRHSATGASAQAYHHQIARTGLSRRLAVAKSESSTAGDPEEHRDEDSEALRR